MNDQEAAATADLDSLAFGPSEEESDGFALRPFPLVGEPEGFQPFLKDLARRLRDSPVESLDATMHETLSSAARLLGVDRCGVARFTSDGRSLVLMQGFAQPWLPQWRTLDLARMLPWYTEEVRQGHSHAWSTLPEDLPRAAARESEYIRAIGLRSHAMVPLRAGAEILGCLGVGRFRTKPTWTPKIVACLERLAAVFADALREQTLAGRLRAAEGLARALLAVAPAALLVLDHKGRVTHVSDAWRRMARCAECPDLLNALEVSGLREGIDSVRQGRGTRFETAYHCAHSGRDLHFRIEATPLDIGGVLVVQTDVSEIEQARAELERSRSEVREVRERLEVETACLRKVAFRVEGFDDIVGTSAALSKVLQGIDQVAAADSPVLLLGETGTGKDLAARAIHERSRRRGRPFVPVNCAALPDALIESELFGYERGAFTGAVARTLGRFEAASGGSILLDEIGDMPLSAQAKLLRVLEAGTFERLGSSKTVHVDVRVIAATNRDLEKEVREGRFRADLYYRLNVFPVALPALRERAEDVPLLVWHFINAKQGALGKSIKRVPDRLMRAFEAYAWPGNVRELENVIERALIVTTGSTLAIDAPFLDANRGEVSSGGSLDDIQRTHILQVLRQCGWKVAGKGNAAERLGLKRGTLQFRMKKLGIRRPESGL